MSKVKNKINKKHKIREFLRQNISKVLIDTSEQEPLECNIQIGDTYGLSTLESPVIIEIFQVPGDGTIYFKLEGYSDLMEFDDLHINDLEIISNYLNGEV